MVQQRALSAFRRDRSSAGPLALVAVGLGLGMLGPAAVRAQTIEWTQRTASAPAAREGHAMSYDTGRGVSVLFGGDTDLGYDGETWEWNGIGTGSWIRRSVGGPSPRYLPAMAHDALRGVTVLFGGRTMGLGGVSDETWEWNGSGEGAWTRRLVVGPSARESPAMAYDADRHVTVLFGGADSGSETWEWDGTSWALRAVGGPSPRYDHVMAYDSARHVTVLFGGGIDESPYFSNETWEWDGESWIRRAVTGPSPRANPSMAFDSSRGVVVLFGGFSVGDGPSAETWEWNGVGEGAWTLRTIAGPQPRAGHAMVYDAAREVMVLFGGQTSVGILDDTWELGAGCRADFDADGSVDFFDYDAFVTCFEGGVCPPGKTADFDADGSVDFFDYDAFVPAFETGC